MFVTSREETSHDPSWFSEITEANPPTNLIAVHVDPTSIEVSWSVPASGATVMGYRIYYDDGTSISSVDVGANVTDHNLTIPHPQNILNYSITIVALSAHLPSTVVGPTFVTVGKQKKLFALMPYSYINIYHIINQITHHLLPILSHLEKPLPYLLWSSGVCKHLWIPML